MYYGAGARRPRAFILLPVSNAKTNVAKLVKETKTLVSNAQEKIKTTIKGYATLMKEKVKTGVSNAVSKVKQTAANVWNKTKQTVSNIAKNPVVQRVTKGVGATLQIAGGIVQTAGGIALSSTGLGAVLGVPAAAHGAADIVQGGLKLFNAITGKSVTEVNFMQEAFKFVGRTVGGAKGEAIASRIFTVADIGLGLISPAKLMGTFSKINNLGDLAKYVKAAPKNIIKNTIDIIPKMFKSAKTAGAKAVGAVSSLGNKLRTSAVKTSMAVKGIPVKAANILSDAKKFTAGFKTTLSNLGQAIQAGTKEYNAAAYKLGITPKSPLAEGIQAGVKKFRELGKSTVSTAKANTWNEFQKATKGQFATRVDAAAAYKKLPNGQPVKSPSAIAQSWQGTKQYPGIDRYRDIRLKEGKVIYRGEPKGSEYFTTTSAVKRTDNDATKLFEGLQVTKHETKGYRPEVKGYLVRKEIDAAFGITKANPLYGSGGLPQIFIPSVQELIDKGILVPVEKIPLKNYK